VKRKKIRTVKHYNKNVLTIQFGYDNKIKTYLKTLKNVFFGIEL